MASAQKKTSVGKHFGIQAVTFDMGHTLLLPRRPLGETCARAAEKIGFRLEPVLAGVRFMDAWHTAQKVHVGLLFGTDLENGKLFWHHVIRLAMQEFHLRAVALDQLTDDLYGVFGDPETWQVNPAWPLVRDELRRRRVRIGVVSNWDIRLAEILRCLGIFAEFDAITISAEQAVEKPDAAIFRAAWTALGARPEEVLHIGDSWRDDVCGAAAAGLHAVWFNPFAATIPDPTATHPQIRCLTELPALLHNSLSVPF